MDNGHELVSGNMAPEHGKIINLETRLSTIFEWITQYFGKVPDDLAEKLNAIENTDERLDSWCLKNESDSSLESNNVNFENLDQTLHCHGNHSELSPPPASPDYDDDMLDIDTLLQTPGPDNSATCSSSSNNALVRTGQVKIVDIRTITTAADYEVNSNPTCTHCSASFNSIPELSVHSLIHCEVRMRHIGRGIRKVNQGNSRSVTRKRKYKYRLRKKPENITYSCKYCTSSFTSKRSFQSHVKLSHRKARRQEQELSAPERECDICNKSFKGKPGLDRHLRSEHPETCPDFPCPTCPKTFKSKKFLQNHVKRVHTVPTDMETCEICGKTFKSRTNLNDHIKRTHPDPSKECECDNCGRRFKIARSLTEHKKRCCVEKTFLCQECGLAVRTEASLRDHILRIHSKANDRPSFKCPHCPNEFKSNDYLKDHIKRHFDKHLKQCPYCGIMKDTTNLYNHITIVHKGRKFTCSYCEAMFSHKAHLKNHYVLKHPDLDIPAEFPVVYTKGDVIPNPEFQSPAATVKPRSTKTPKTCNRKNEKTSDLSCSSCEAVFATRNELELHMIRHEKDPDYKLKRRLPVKRLLDDQPSTENSDT